MTTEFGYNTVRNITLGFVIGVVLCLVTLAMEAAFNTQEVVMLF